MRLQDRVAIVTGGGRGIGEATALALAREGVRLSLVSRTASELEKVARQVVSLGGEALVASADVARQEDVARIVDKTLTHYGKVDILVNAAGVYGPIGPTAEVDIEQWVRAIKINLIGTFLCSRLVLPHMIERRSGRIINFSGGGATSALPRFAAYGVSKTAVVRLTETLAEEVKEFNIGVNSIAPGAVDTRLQDAVLAAGDQAGDLFQRIRRMRETGEGGVPVELSAGLVVFLASDAAAGLTGKLIAAPYDGWESWNDDRIKELMEMPWFTLRRMDPFTLKPFMSVLK